MNAARPGQVAMQRGFTLVELMVTLTILVMLLMIAVPAVLRAIQNARTSTLVHRLPQDVAWARNQSATTPALYRITLGSGCQWKIELADLSGATPSWTTNAQIPAQAARSAGLHRKPLTSTAEARFPMARRPRSPLPAPTGKPGSCRCCCRVSCCSTPRQAHDEFAHPRANSARRSP